MNDDLNPNQQIQSFSLPWDRCWARCIDLTIHMVIFFLIYRFSGISAYVVELRQQTGHINFTMYIIVWGIVIALFLLYEILFLCIFGATPGKILFKIRVVGSDGKKLGFGAAFLRAISLSWFGLYLYFGISFGLIIGFFLSSRYYKKTGTFRWDTFSNSIVSQIPLTTWRRNVSILLAIFFITLRLLPECIFVYVSFREVLK